MDPDPRHFKKPYSNAIKRVLETTVKQSELLQRLYVNCKIKNSDKKLDNKLTKGPYY